MVDIFVCYASTDRARVAPLAQALAEHGWSVWWDQQIPPGKTFDEMIEKALDEARAVVPVWTENGIASRWVRTEAAEGAAREILVPVVMGEMRIPLAFRRIQAADLTDWEPGHDHRGFAELIDALEDLIGRPNERPTLSPGLDDPVERALLAAKKRAAEKDWERVIALLSSLETESPALADEHPEAIDLLTVARRKRDAGELYEEVEVFYADGRWDDVVSRFDRILELDPEFEYGTDLRSRAERHIGEEREERLAHDYARAADALEMREWTIAVARFEELQAAAPDYRDIASELELARLGAMSERRYDELRGMLREEQWADVVVGMEGLAETNPDFGDSDDLLGQAQAHIERAKQPTTEIADRERAEHPIEPAAATTVAATSAPVAGGLSETAAAPDGAAPDDADEPRLATLRRRAPGWSFGVLAIVSAYLPWLNPEASSFINSANVQMAILWDPDRWYRRAPLALAIPILILGILLLVAGARAERRRLRRGAGISLVVFVVLYGIAVWRTFIDMSELFTSLGPYLALATGIAASLRDPFLQATRTGTPTPEPAGRPRLVALSLGAGGALLGLLGLAFPWWWGAPAFELNGGAPFGIGNPSSPSRVWPVVSMGALVLAVVVAGAVLVAIRRGERIRALLAIAAVMFWVVAGFGLATAGSGRGVGDILSRLDLGFWVALAGATTVLLAVPVARLVDNRTPVPTSLEPRDGSEPSART